MELKEQNNSTLNQEEQCEVCSDKPKMVTITVEATPFSCLRCE